MSLARTVAWNTAIQLAGRMVGLLASMLITALLTRHLGLASFGQFVAASTYVALFTVLGDAGLFVVTVRRASQEPARRAAILGNGLSLRLLTALGVLGLAFGIGLLIPSSRYPTYSGAVKVLIGVMAVNGYITLLFQFMTVPFRLHLRMDFAVWGELLARSVNFVAVLLVIRAGGGVVAVALAFLAGSVANLVYSAHFARRFEKFQLQLDPILVRELLKEAAILATVSVLGLIHFRVDTILLSLLRPAEDVGVYGVAYRVHEVFVMFPGLLVGLLFPVFSRLAAESEQALRHVFQRTFDVLLLAAVGATLLVYVEAPTLASLLGAPMAALPMRILAFALVPAYLTLGFSHLVLAEGRQRGLLLLISVATPINIIANWICIQEWSYAGAAAVTVGTECLQLVCLVAYWVGHRVWRLHLRSVSSIPLACVLGVALDYGMQWMPTPDSALSHRILGLGASSLATCCLYAGALLAFRVVAISDFRRLLGARDDTRQRSGTVEGH